MATYSKTAGNARSGTTAEAKPKRTFKERREDAERARGVGFSHGWYAIEELPKERGVKRAAQRGFKQGSNAREKALKAEEKARKYRY